MSFGNEELQVESSGFVQDVLLTGGKKKKGSWALYHFQIQNPSGFHHDAKVKEDKINLIIV